MDKPSFITGELIEWDFNDLELNNAKWFISKQENARDLEIVQLDKINNIAIFFDIDGEDRITTLAWCTCHTFNYFGPDIFNKHVPCKHIYRLANELGLMDLNAQLVAYKRARKNDELYLRSLPRDHNAWGNWNKKTHEIKAQHDRLIKAYKIIADGDHILDESNKKAFIHGYETTLQSCSCTDFQKRKFPCKHIYTLAIMLNIISTSK